MPVRSGWPSGVRGSGVFFIWPAAPAVAAPATSTASISRFTSASLLAGQRLLAPLAVHQLLDELDALEVHDLRVLLEPAVERHADLPRLREHVGILDGRFVGEDVRRRPRPALDDVQRVAV